MICYLNVKVEVDGASKMLSFDEDGQIKNAKYDIVNFDAVNGYFKEVSHLEIQLLLFIYLFILYDIT